MYHNDLSELDFTGQDLRETALTGTILSGKNGKACFKNTFIGTGTFSSEGHSATVSSIAFDFTGGKFVSASYDKTLGIWNTSSGERLAELEGHRHYVRCAAWSPDGRTIISGGDDGELFVWDVASWLRKNGKKISISLDDHDGWIYSAGWSCSGKQFASGDSMGTLCIWNYVYGKRPELERKIPKCHQGSIRCLAWSPVGNDIFASGSTDGKIKLWVHQEEKVSVEAGRAGISALAWSTDGKEIIAGAGTELSIWKIYAENEKFDLKKVENWKVPGDRISGIIWAKDFLAYGVDREIHILRINQAKEPEKEEETFRWRDGSDIEAVAGHQSLIQCLAWSSMEQKLLTGSDDSSIRIWKARSPLWHKDWSCIRVIEGSSLPVRCVAWSEDSSYLVGGYDDNILRKWDIEHEVCCNMFWGHENRIKCVDWKGNYLVSGSNDNSVRIWDAGDCKSTDLNDRTLKNTLDMKKCGGAVIV